MASTALNKNETALLFAIFKVVDTHGLDYTKLSAEIGCKKELMANRMYVLKKKVNSRSPTLTPNDCLLLAAVFKVVNTSKLDYGKLSAEIGCKKELMANRMYILRKKLGVNPGQASGNSGAAVATRAGNKSAVRAGRGNNEKPTTGKGRDRSKEATPEPESSDDDADPEVDESENDDEMQASNQETQETQETQESEDSQDTEENSKSELEEYSHEFQNNCQNNRQQDYQHGIQGSAREDTGQHQQDHRRQYAQYNQQYQHGIHEPAREETDQHRQDNRHQYAQYNKHYLGYGNQDLEEEGTYYDALSDVS